MFGALAQSFSAAVAQAEQVERAILRCLAVGGMQVSIEPLTAEVDRRRTLFAADAFNPAAAAWESVADDIMCGRWKP